LPKAYRLWLKARNMKTTKLILVISLMISLGACSKKEEIKQEENQKLELSEHTKSELSIAPAVAENVENSLILTGKVEPFEERQVKVSPLVDGIIEKLSANLGDYVQKGKTLAIVHSTDVADLENQTISSKTDLVSAQKNLQVQQDLFKSGLATEKDVLLAQNEITKSKGALGRANEVSGIYGVKNSFYTLKAPISGYVVDKNSDISDKMSYHEGETGAFFTIADLSEVQVIANVYESDIAKVKLGYPVKVSLIAYPDKIFTGKIDKISNVLDPQTRTMTVRINLKNAGNLLKPEMFAQITVEFDQSKKLVSIPAEAVIFDKNKNYVIVYKGAKDIVSREVQIAQTTNGKSFIYSGLQEGEQVMLKNQLMIYNALTN
jgi:membrane fusion protein, heavy metal efflux system